MSLLFLDALRTINHLDEESNVKHHQLHVQLRLFRNQVHPQSDGLSCLPHPSSHCVAQRNAYMSGFALFLMFVAWRLQHITMRVSPPAFLKCTGLNRSFSSSTRPAPI